MNMIFYIMQSFLPEHADLNSNKYVVSFYDDFKCS